MLRTALLVVLLGCGSYGEWSAGDSGGPSSDSSETRPTDSGQGPHEDAATSASDGGTGLVSDASYDTPDVCTSGQYWTLGNTKSANMQPGAACRSCHVLLGQASSYDFDISGTVYPTAHEPDQCDGIGPMSVVITDANGVDHVLAVNAVGNFYNNDGFGFLKIPVPYKAKVVSDAGTRAMISSQSNGDCNSCHTQSGTMLAPGRIMAP